MVLGFFLLLFSLGYLGSIFTLKKPVLKNLCLSKMQEIVPTTFQEGRKPLPEQT